MSATIDIHNLTPETLLGRNETALALTAAGFRTKPSTLATKASRGGGPPFAKYGCVALYRWGTSLEWAQGRMSLTGKLLSLRDYVVPTNYDPEKGLKSVAVAEAGERHFARAKDAKQLLAAIKAKLIAQGKYVVWRDGMARSAVFPAGKGSKGGKISELKSYLPASDPGDVTAHRWRKCLCIKDETGTRIDTDKLANALKDAGHRCARICEQENDGTIRGTEGTGEFERYTPSYYIEAARSVLGEIDLDPATSEIAQRTVKAAKYFTAKSKPDGLKRDWHGRVWLNPPYHRDLAPLFIEKLIAEFEARRITAAIVLTNNCTDTAWFHEAMTQVSAVCFTRGRVKFYDVDGAVAAPTQGQAFSYFGDDPNRFAEVFKAIGFVLRPL
jgi:hypothetical protein